MAQHGGRRPGAGPKRGQISEAKRIIAEMARKHAETALGVLVEIALRGESEAARVSAVPCWIGVTASRSRAWN